MSWSVGDRWAVGEVLDTQADRLGDKVCVYFQDEPVTYAEMTQRSNALANGLAGLGLERRQCVAILMENSAEMVYTMFGAHRLGAIEVAINSAYKGEFLRHQLGNCEAGIVVVDDHLAPRVLAIAGELPDLRKVVVRSTGAEKVRFDAPRNISIIDMDELIESSQGSVPSAVAPRWDDPCSIVYTGGTSGPSKGVLLTQNYLVMFAKQMGRAWEQSEDDVMYSPLPLFHLNAKGITVFGSILAGGCGVLDRKFSVSGTWDRVRRYNATGVSLLGSMFVMLWNLPESPSDADLPIRAMIGAPVPPELHLRIEERYGCRIVVPYGLSEAAPLTLLTTAHEPTIGSSGPVNPLFEVRLLDDDEREVAVGEVGEVVCRPRQPHVMFEGYYRNAEATVACYKNMWFHSGDLGRFDEQMNFYFVDRKKDAMRRRGENISSFEVEAAVRTHPAIADVAAHAVPSEFSEDDVKICAVLKEGRELTAIELMDHCVENMPYFAVPRYIEFLDDLPRSPVARVLKYVLRERGVTSQTWDREAAGYAVRR
jgi:crotonobetaine/carnitine-CoA ligase